MFKSQQYRAKAAEYGELTKRSIGPDEIGKFQQLQDRLASLADNEQGLADDYDSARCGAGRIERRSPCNRRRARFAVSRRGHHHAMERPADDAAARDLSTPPGRSASYWRRRRSAGKSPDFCTSTRMMPVAANCP
jgi:hypothetical protein